MSLRHLQWTYALGGGLFCSLAALSAPCFAQTPPAASLRASEKPRPLSPTSDLTMPNSLTLLYQPDIQAEIALTPTQRQQLQARWIARMTGRPPLNIDALKQMTARQRRGRLLQERAQMRDIREGMQGDLDAAFIAILRGEQTRRLRELDLQRRGPFAFAEPKTADALELSPGQRRQVTAFIIPYRAARQRLQQANDDLIAPPPAEEEDTLRRLPPPPDIEEKMTRIRETGAKAETAEKTARAALLRLLTPEQTAHWQTLLGKTFAFAAPHVPKPDERAAPDLSEKG